MRRLFRCRSISMFLTRCDKRRWHRGLHTSTTPRLNGTVDRYSWR